MTQPYRSSASGTVQDIADKTKDQIENMADTASQKGREISDNVQKVTENFRSAAERSLRDQPYTTLALAAGVAFVLGAVWKS